MFERDGWRCAVPGCSARGNLQDHHLRYRSQGGDNSLDNRIALCVWHHQHGIHDGVVSARGQAPDDIYWKLGVRADGGALLELRGETYVAR
ncbi:MAG: HNH endonuclease [Deltaproteobacteria bacterium]|nr:MAG: HNH endonuclease [Deltaproteobacteria bacterium]